MNRSRTQTFPDAFPQRALGEARQEIRKLRAVVAVLLLVVVMLLLLLVDSDL
jgi:hypothetical protein